MKTLSGIFLTGVLLTTLTVATYAQGIGLGIKGGMNFANQSITDISTDTRTGFNGGAYVVINFGDKWGLQPELLFSSQGAELPSSTREFDYMALPILIRYKPISLLSFEFGPQFSRLLDAKNGGTNVTDDFKDTDFGLALGTTVHLPLGFNASARYVWGFTDINNLQNDQEVKNTVFQLTAGWTIFGAK